MESTDDHLTKISGPFFGNGLETAQLEKILVKHYNPKWLVKEPDRMNTTWFDYRMVHPVRRVYYFQHCYIVAWRAALKKFFDRDMVVENLFPTRQRDLFMCRKRDNATGEFHDSKVIGQTISAMHIADELCIPYDVFFEAGFHHYMQERQFTTVWRKRRDLADSKLPPARLFMDGGVAIAAQTLFERRNAKKLIVGTHHAFCAGTYQGYGFQKDHEKYLVDQCLARGAGAMRLMADLVFNRKLLRPAGVIEWGGVEVARSLFDFAKK